MALEPREKKLAVAVGALIGLLAVWYGWTSYADAVALKRGQIEALEREVARKQMLAGRARVDNQKLSAWAERSLPRLPDAAASAYQSWLVGIAESAGLKQANIEPGRSTKLPGLGIKLPFSFRAKGSLAQTAAWLAAFYRADHLHQLRDLSLQPTPDGASIQINAGIEALALDASPRSDTLGTSAGARLDEARAAELVAAITKRNIFAPYVPPPPPTPPPMPVVENPPPPPPPAFDPAAFTFLSSIVFVQSQAEAWLDVRPTNQLLKLHVGDAVEVGRFKGKVVRIGDREMEIEADGKRRLVSLGKALGQAVELPATQP